MDATERITNTLRLAGIDPATVSADLWSLLYELDAVAETMSDDEIALLREAVTELRQADPPARAQFARALRRAALSPDEARAAVLAELEEHGEPRGETLGDWLMVDPAAQALFKHLYQTMMEPSEGLHVQPLGLVLAA